MIWMFAQLAAQAIQGSMQYQQDIKMQKLQNKADEAYNKAVRAASARQITEINLQRTAARQQTSQALSASQSQALGEQSNRGLQAAATDTMGASVAQNLQDVNIQLDQVSSTLMQNAAYQELSFDSQVYNTIDSARNAVRDLTSPLGSDYAALGQAVGAVGTSMVSNKLSGKGWFGGAGDSQAPAPVSQSTGTKTQYGLSTRLNL